jgi:hypothetical protein
MPHMWSRFSTRIGSKVPFYTELEMSSDKSEPEKKSPDVVDIILAKRGETLMDSETMIMETQKRVWGALKKGFSWLYYYDIRVTCRKTCNYC